MEIGRRAFGKIENRTAVLLIAFLKNESRILSQQHLMKRYTRENTIAVLSESQLIIDNKAICILS